jgi:type I restriction enzyme S subunit
VTGGDVLVSTVRTYLKAIAHAPTLTSPLVCSTGFAVLTPRSSLDSRFLFYWARSSFFVDEVVARSTGVSYPAINPSDLGQLPVPELPLRQQRRIAGFLDAKLARLDELARKKERQLALLAENRQALITHAVTCGLNPNAPTKPSNLPQLGAVPAHWTPTRLKYLARIRYGLGQPPKPQADGLRMIRATNVDAGRITPENMAFIDPSEVPESRDATLKAGEIIVVRSGAYTCDSAIIPAEYEGAIAGYDMIVRVKKVEPEFVAYSLLSGPVRDAQLKPCSLRAAQPHLNAEELGDCVLAVPPREEQREIVSFLSTATTRFDAVTTSIKLQHTKLSEYRQALITAAVTGQVTIPEEAA